MKKEEKGHMKILRYLFLMVVIAFGFIAIVGTGGDDDDGGGGDGSEQTSGPGEGVDPGSTLSDGTTGDPVFTLTWSHMESDEGPDIDMWVIDPTHEMLSTSRDGAGLGPTYENGTIDHDDQGASGPGDGGGPERAYWPPGSAPAGIYTYGIRYYAGSGSADYSFRVYKAGSLSATRSGTVYSSSDREVLGAACNVTAFQDLCDLYNSAKSSFTYCQHLAYAAATGSAPPIPTTKADVWTAMDNNGYIKSYEGAVPSTYDPGQYDGLMEGDIVMLYSGDPPNDHTNADHYAVVRNGKLWQVLHWSRGGQLDGPRDLSEFGNPRTFINAYDGQSKTTSNPYVWYVAYAKRNE